LENLEALEIRVGARRVETIEAATIDRLSTNQVIPQY